MQVRGEGELVIRQSRRKSAWAAFGCLIFAALVLFDLTRKRPSTVQLVCELPGLVFFGLGGVVLVFVAIRSPILATIGDDGIHFRRSDLIPWARVAKWRVAWLTPFSRFSMSRLIPSLRSKGLVSQRMLGVVPADIEAYLASVSPMRRTSTRLSVAITGTIGGIPESAVSMTLEQLIESTTRFASIPVEYAPGTEPAPPG